MKKIITLACFLLCATYLLAQDEFPDYVPSTHKDWGISLSGFAQSVGYLGPTLGVEYLIKDYTVASFQTGVFYDKNKNEPDVFLSWDIGTQETFPSGFSPDFRIGMGYLSSFVGKRKNWPSELNAPNRILYFIPSIKVGLLGYDFRKRKKIPVRIFGNVLFYWKITETGNTKSYRGFSVGGTYFFK